MATPVITPPEPVKVEFTPEQQEHINGLFNTRFAKVQTKHEAEMKAMSDAIEALKTTKVEPPPVVVPPSGDPEENKRQMKALLDAEKLQTRNIQSLLDVEKAAKEKVIAENKRILKEQAINDAAQNLPNGLEFHELKTVKKLTEDDISFDEDSNQWVVKENGVIKQNASLIPMTLSEYFASFAAARPYLVKGTTKGGSGGAEGGTPTVRGVGVVRTKADVKSTKEKVDYITNFGYDAWAKLPTK
jgi:hypothetical protein